MSNKLKNPIFFVAFRSFVAVERNLLLVPLNNLFLALLGGGVHKWVVGREVGR